MRKPQGTMEKRAAGACHVFDELGGGTFHVEWRKSRTWGRCPAVMWHGDKAAYASGCGYDKLSTVVCEFLRWLPGTPEHGLISGGAGVRSAIEELAACGWTLIHEYDGKTEDGFRLERQ